MILDLHRPGLSVSAIARRAGLDRKTVRRYVERGLEPPTYGPRPPRESKVTRFERYLRGRVGTFPELTAIRLLREIRELGYAGGYTAVKDFVREIRPSRAAGFEVRFETTPGRQARQASAAATHGDPVAQLNDLPPPNSAPHHMPPMRQNTEAGTKRTP